MVSPFLAQFGALPGRAQRHHRSLRLQRDEGELMRYLGYAAGASPSPRRRRELEAIVERGLELLAPAGIHRSLPVLERRHDGLVLGGGGEAAAVSGVEIRGRVSEFLGDVREVHVFLVTVGKAISHAASEACAMGDPLSGWVLDALGSWAAEATVDALLREVGAGLEKGHALTLRYSPGYCGMRLEVQRDLFRLLDTSVLDVSLRPSCLMEPEKSVSGIVGVGKEGSVAVRSSPCERCSQERCPMRRSKAHERP